MKKKFVFLIALALFSVFQPFSSFGQSNQYLHFDGVDDHILRDSAVQVLTGSTEASMAGWFYSDALVYGSGMMSIRGGGSGDGKMYILQLSNGALECRLITSTGLHQVVGPAGTIQANVWQHIAWVYNGSTVELFIDGASIGSSSASGTFVSVDRPFTVGKSIEGNLNFMFKGRADEVSLWSKALSLTDIQNMIANELTGNETDLELYYKFDQGIPGGDNTSLNELTSNLTSGDLDADLTNFALMGATSNFNGVLESGVQAISFPSIANKVITSLAFDLNAIASSGLAVNYNIVSGPATISGNTVTLTGSAGEVIVEASQPGNSTYSAATTLTNSFQVFDPALQFANIDARNPLSGDVYSPNLEPIQLAGIVDIDYSDLFSVQSVDFKVNGQSIVVEDWGNTHYTGWWTPTANGTATFEIIATNNFGASITETINFNVVGTAPTTAPDAFSDVWVYSDVYSVEVDGVLPSYTGAFDQINGLLDIQCPSGGCDPWDRVSHIEVKGHNGEWYEIIRYLTPYGVACNHSIDLTDFMSLLQGKVTFRISLGTSGNGFLYSLNLDYVSGTPVNSFSKVDKLWNQTYAFGDMADLTPCEGYTINYDNSINSSKIKLVSTGHGWGDNNTDNAAEFHEDTHHIHVNNIEKFSQHNWNDCNPNPDDCSPQNGTWYHNRAGWCPGSIAQWFDFDMTEYVNDPSIELDYIFNQSYQDLCHPNNVNCITGVTCSDCNAGFNPHLVVNSYLISYSDQPIDLTEQVDLLSTDEIIQSEIDMSIYPNPSFGKFDVSVPLNTGVSWISIYDVKGNLILKKNFQDGYNMVFPIDLTGIDRGVYMVVVSTEKGNYTRKVVVE